MKANLDCIDESIIEVLQERARTTIKEISAKVFLSSPAVTARIERLERKGVIRGYHAQLDLETLGYRIKAFINLEMDEIPTPKLYDFIESVPNVIECNCVAGDDALLIEAAFTSNAQLDQFVSELQNFGRTKTQIVFSTPVEHRNPITRRLEETLAI